MVRQFGGAKTSQKFRTAPCKRPAFQRRDLLPAPRKALRLRFGEQKLHSNSAPQSASGGFFSGAICSPLPAKPCGFVPGSKNFTEIPRRHLPPAVFSAARFAPRPPQSLAASFRGAKSSQRFRAAICLRRPFQRRDLLPAPRKALRLRFGEQNLHRSSAPPSASGDSCWRRPAGKAIYHRRATPTGRPKFRLPADHVGAAPPAKPYITVGPRQQGTQNPARRPTMLAPPRRQSHISPSGHANRAPRIPPAGRPCWRRPSGKALIYRRATPTGRPKSRPAADHVGAVPPANAYITVGPRQQGAPNPARRSTMLAPPLRQSLDPPSGHANRAPRL